MHWWVRRKVKICTMRNEVMIIEGIRNEMWLDFYMMKSRFIFLNLSMFATVGNRNMMDLVVCPGWISILEAGIGVHLLDLSLSHINTFPPCIIFAMSFRFTYFSLCCSATSPFSHTSSFLSVGLPPSLFTALSVLSHKFSLSVSFWFSLWSLSSWACLGGGLAAASQAAVCCWSCATTEALWLTRYLFV